MESPINLILTGIIFAMLGFFLAFSLRVATNIILLCIFVYASLLAFNYLGVFTNWHLFDEFINHLSKLGKMILSFVRRWHEMARFPSILSFLLGGFLGFVLKRSVYE